MTIEELQPLPILKVHFALSSFKLVPRESGCYVLSTFDKQVLYIGLTESLYKRFKEHLANPEKTNPTAKGKAIWFYFMKYDIKNLQRLERTWLNQYVTKYGVRPILNKVDSPVS